MLLSGDMVSIREPNGFPFQGKYDKICMQSGKIAITSLHCMIWYYTDKKPEDEQYSNRFEDEVAFKDDFDE